VGAVSVTAPKVAPPGAGLTVLAHIAADETERRGLCGAEIAGIEPFGPFERCVVCQGINSGRPR
jgi:hypothetical protein